MKQARALTETCLRALREIVELDSTAAAVLSAKVRAADILLSRGWGTAPQTITIDGDLKVDVIWHGPQ